LQTKHYHVNVHCSLQVIGERKVQMLIDKEKSSQISGSDDEAMGG
jgi:hypothetical protein